MGADPDWFIQKKLAKTPQGLEFFGKEALAEYMRCFRNPETIHAICEDYRATFGVDLEMDTKDFAAGRKIDTSGAAAVGRDRRRRPQPPAGPGEIWKRYASRHPRRQGAAVRALSVGRGAGGDLSGASEFFWRNSSICRMCSVQGCLVRSGGLEGRLEPGSRGILRTRRLRAPRMSANRNRYSAASADTPAATSPRKSGRPKCSSSVSCSAVNDARSPRSRNTVVSGRSGWPSTRPPPR